MTAHNTLHEIDFIKKLGTHSGVCKKDDLTKRKERLLRKYIENFHLRRNWAGIDPVACIEVASNILKDISTERVLKNVS